MLNHTSGGELADGMFREIAVPAPVGWIEKLVEDLEADAAAEDRRAAEMRGEGKPPTMVARKEGVAIGLRDAARALRARALAEVPVPAPTDGNFETWWRENEAAVLGNLFNLQPLVAKRIAEMAWTG